MGAGRVRKAFTPEMIFSQVTACVTVRLAASEIRESTTNLTAPPCRECGKEPDKRAPAAVREMPGLNAEFDQKSFNSASTLERRKTMGS